MGTQSRIVILLMLFTLAGCATGPALELIHQSGVSNFPKGKTYILVEEDMVLFLSGFSALIKEKFPKSLASKGVDSELLTKDNITAASREVAYLMRVSNARPDFEAKLYTILVIVSLGKTDLYSAGFILNPDSISSVKGWDDASSQFVDTVVLNIFNQ